MRDETRGPIACVPRAAESGAGDWARRLLSVEPGEGRLLGLAWVYAFTILAANYVLRPLRDELGVVVGSDQLAWSYTGTFLVTAAVSPLFGALVSQYSRRRFIPYAHRCSELLLLGGFAVLQFGPAAAQRPCAWFMFAWISTFNLLAVSMFWGLMADCIDRERAKRLFGVIAIGATLGAIAGSTAVWQVSAYVSPLGLALGAILLLEIANPCVRAIATIAQPTPAQRSDMGARDGNLGAAPPALPVQTDDGAPRYAASDAGRDEKLRRGGAWGGIVETLRSPYLLGICAYLLLMTATSTFVYYEQTRLVESQLATSAARRQYFARTDLCVNTICLVAQALLTGRLVQRAGVGATAAFLPLVTAGGFAWLAAAYATPAALPVLFWFQVGRRAADYGVSRPAREVLFTVVPRAQKYKSKSFIDTFVYRGGDLAAVWAYSWYRDLTGASMIQTAWLVGGACAVWIVLSIVLGAAAGRQNSAAPISMHM